MPISLTNSVIHNPGGPWGKKKKMNLLPKSSQVWIERRSTSSHRETEWYLGHGNKACVYLLGEKTCFSITVAERQSFYSNASTDLPHERVW